MNFGSVFFQFKTILDFWDIL